MMFLTFIINLSLPDIDHFHINIPCVSSRNTSQHKSSNHNDNFSLLLQTLFALEINKLSFPFSTSLSKTHKIEGQYRHNSIVQ